MMAIDFIADVAISMLIGCLFFVGIYFVIHMTEDKHEDHTTCVNGQVYFKKKSEDFWRPMAESCLSTIKE
jgi:hypothetical protein